MLLDLGEAHASFLREAYHEGVRFGAVQFRCGVTGHCSFYADGVYEAFVVECVHFGA